ncbi:MAG: MFS transporter [Bacteroidota bacterium]
MESKPRLLHSPFNLLVIVAALGYFVDIYDLILFNVVKKDSLLALGLAGDNLESNEIFLFNCQMAGMMVGGILWGILGDRRGRLSVLFGSILMYSLANMFNAFVTDLNLYALVRFVAGLGLAGELGAGITLVVESMTKENRGYGTMLIVTFGALGAVFASLVGAQGAVIAEWSNSSFGTSFVGWQMAYLVGGILGILLLLLRAGTLESRMYLQARQSGADHGNLFKLLSQKHLLSKYVYCILIGIPVWYIIGVLVALCIPISEELGISGIFMPKVILFSYMGLSVGDLLSGMMSQVLKSRKKVIVLFLILSLVFSVLYLFPVSTDLDWFYMLCFVLGAVTGYWALFVTLSSESFGTNIRSTVTNTVPNFVRGSVVPITLLYKFLSGRFVGEVAQPRVWAALVVGVLVFSLALWAISRLKDSFSEDLDYSETL